MQEFLLRNVIYTIVVNKERNVIFMKFKKLFNSLFVVLVLTVSLSSVVYAGSSCISLDEQEEKYGHTWNNEQTPNWGEAWQCQGFALRMKYETTARSDDDVNKWKRIYKLENITDLEAGDVVRYTIKSTSTTELHSIFIREVCDDGTIYFADANWDKKNGIRWYKEMDDNLKKRIMTSINKEGTSQDPTYFLR